MKIVSFQDLQSKKLSVIANELSVTPKELTDFLMKVVITNSEGRLKFGIWNKLKRKK